MAAVYIVIVSARTRALCDEGPDMLNGGEATRSAVVDHGRHLRESLGEVPTVEGVGYA